MADSISDAPVLEEEQNKRTHEADDTEIPLNKSTSKSQPSLYSELSNDTATQEPNVRRSRRLMGHRRSWKNLRHKAQKPTIASDEQFPDESKSKVELNSENEINSHFGDKEYRPTSKRRKRKIKRKRKSSLFANEMLEDSEFWMLLSTALNESSGDSEPCSSIDTDSDIAIIRQAVKEAEEKPFYTSLQKTPQLFDHFEVLNHNAQEFDKYSIKDADSNFFRCKACDQNYVCSTALTRHMKTHVCGICNQFYVVKSELLDHKWVHRADRAKDATVSMKNLPARYTISSKNRTVIARCTHKNAKDKKYHCKPCRFHFHNNDTLMRHMTTHICKQCDAFFRDKIKLKIHKRDHRDGNTSALCDDMIKNTRDEKVVGATPTIVEDQMKENVQSSETSVVPEISLTRAYPSNDSKIASPSSAETIGSSYLLPPGDEKSVDSSDLQQNILEMMGVTVSNKYIVTIAPVNSTCTVTSSQVSVNSISTSASEASHINQEIKNSFSRLGQFILSSSSVPSGKQILNESDSQDEKERNFPCSVCGKKFFSKGNLKGHFETHSDTRGYGCSVCKKSFRRKHTLEKHKKTHLK